MEVSDMEFHSRSLSVVSCSLDGIVRIQDALSGGEIMSKNLQQPLT